MHNPLIAAGACLVLLALPALAQEVEADIVRLPEQGTLKIAPLVGGLDRLVPGGGLLMSFDSNSDGLVTREEREIGTQQAFAEADSDGNGTLTAFEQQAWADSLPTRDDSLSNPVRFDPNLDRQVSLEEFTAVIESIAAAYASEDTGEVAVASLQAPPRRIERQLRRPGAQARTDISY